jgi:transposase
MKAHSKEFREHVMQAVDKGEFTQEEIARVFGVNVRWIRKLIVRRRETGSLAPSPHRGGPPPRFTPEIDERLREFIAEHADATLKEIREGLPLDVSLNAISKALRRLGFTRKKKVTHATERDRPDVQAKRRTWMRQRRKWNAKKLVFVDETGVSTQLQRTSGRAPRGVRVTGAVPENHYHASTLAGAMRWNGQTTGLVYDGGTDVATLLTFVERQLAPLLKKGDVVIWDNLQAHKSPVVRDAIERCGATIRMLPPYSPDWNPIEKLWSKAKAFLRGAAARTKETLLDALKQALDTIRPQDIQHWFEHCGYRPIPS